MPISVSEALGHMDVQYNERYSGRLIHQLLHVLTVSFTPREAACAFNVYGLT